MARDCIELSEKGHELLEKFQQSFSKTNETLGGIFPDRTFVLPESEEYALELCVRVAAVMADAAKLPFPISPQLMMAVAMQALRDEGLFEG